MGRPDLRSVPMPEGEVRVTSQTDVMQAEEIARMLSENQQLFKDNRFDIFGDKILIEAVYKDFLKSIAGEGEFDAVKIAEETGSTVKNVNVMAGIIREIVGMPDVTPPEGEPGGNAVPEEPAATEAKGKMAM